VAEAFWTNSDVGEVPYQRGDLIALYVDHAIRARSQGARSLDDLMRALVERARAGAGLYSNDELCAAIAEFAGDEAGAVVRRWALEGVEPELLPDAAGPEFVLEPAEVPTFHTGFDHAATLASGTVSGVVAGGCAERAGLRDGMRITGWSVSLGQTAAPVEVRVREDGTECTLSYLPHGVPVRGYRLRARL
jgi:predicted metalloprotease with PDZ domain